MTPATYVAALLREREGYLAKDRPGRAKEVEAELRRAGHKGAFEAPKAAPKA